METAAHTANQKQKQTSNKRHPNSATDAVRSLNLALPGGEVYVYFYKTNVFVGRSKALGAGSGGGLWGPEAPPRSSWAPRGGLGAFLGGALGGPWGSLGWPRGALREHFGQTGGFAKSKVLFVKNTSWLSEGALMEPGGRGESQNGRRRGKWEPRRTQQTKNKTSRSR